MRNFLISVIHNRRILFFIIALIFALGVYMYVEMPKQETPTISAPVVILTCTYPGASPEDMETYVTDVIEEELQDVSGIDYTQSSSIDSASIVIVILDIHADKAEVYQTVRDKMKDIESDLPDGSSKVDVNTKWNDTAGFLLTLSGEAYSQDVLSGYADTIEQQIKGVNGISRVTVFGENTPRIAVTVDYQALNQYDVSLDQINQLIMSHNLAIPSGKIEGALGKINVKTQGEFKTLEDIQNLIVAGDKSGAVVRLRDVAMIAYERDPDQAMYVSDGKDAVLIAGYFNEEINVIKTGKSLDVVLGQAQTLLPSDISLKRVLYQPATVKAKVDNLVVSLFQGIFFVIIVVFVGMGLRNAAVVSIAIPLSMMATFIVMGLLHYQIHMISIAALIIALGMLVDNAIVVSDAIQVRLDQDEERLKACVDGTLEVALPVFTSTLTTIAVFLPLMMLDTIAGEFIISIPVVVITSLLASYVVALLVTPTLAYLFYKKRQIAEKAFFLKDLYVGLLKWTMVNKVFSALMILVALLTVGIIMQNLGLQFFPKAEIDLLVIDIVGDNEADLSKTEDLQRQVETLLKSYPEVDQVTSAIGDGFPKFFYTMASSTAQKNYAQMIVNVSIQKEGFKSKAAMVEAIQKRLNVELAGGKATIKELEQGEPLGAPVRLRLYGEDMKALKAAEGKIKTLLATIPGSTNIHSDFSDYTFEYGIDVDQTKSNFLGLNSFDIQNEISFAIAGRQVSKMNIDKKEYPVFLTSTISTITELENLGIRSSVTGNKTLLKDIASVSLKEKLPAIRHYNGIKTINVYSDVLMGYSSITVQEQLGEILSDMAFEGVDYAFEGEAENINEEFGGIGISAIFALFLIYIILLIQFGSFVQPLIIFSTIPLSAMGSIIGLWLFKQPLSFTALFGMVALFGIVVNNAIILIDYMNIKVREGMEIKEVCYKAINQRFRPIMLTTTTTVIGLIPLVTSGSPLFRPMSIALMFGLAVSTLLTLVVVPVFYLVLQKIMIKIEMGALKNSQETL